MNMHVLVSKCALKTNSFQQVGATARPPYDLVVISQMNRKFCDPSKEGHVYFHLHLDCLRRKQPYFNQRMTVVPAPMTRAFLFFLQLFGLLCDLSDCLIELSTLFANILNYYQGSK